MSYTCEHGIEIGHDCDRCSAPAFRLELLGVLKDIREELKQINERERAIVASLVKQN